MAAPPTIGPVIVTGGCGFIGSHLVDGLLKAEPGCRIHVLDINNTNQNQFAGVIYHNCDITDTAKVEAIFHAAQPKTVFHAACPDPLVLDSSRFRHVNVGGTHNLLVTAKKTKTVQAFVFTCTSSAIHDNVSDIIDADESFPVVRYPQQKRVYTLTKVEAEDEVLATNRQDDGVESMLTLSVRPATAFGARDFTCMGRIVATCRSGGANKQIGPGKNYYDFIYVSNLVDGHILAAQALIRAWGKPPPDVESDRVDGQAFIFTNNERVLFWDFHRAIAKSIGIEVKPEDIKIIPRWVAMLFATISEWTTWITTFGTKQSRITTEAVHLTTITRTLKCDKARRLLGYSPKITISDGLEMAGSWFVEEAKKDQATCKKTI